MSLLKKIAGVLFGLVAILFSVGFLLPSAVHVERSVLINAEPAEVFDLVSNFNAWDAWSPWAQLDPDANMEIIGSGIGQTMFWSSENPEVGEGSQVIVNLESPRYLKTHLNFGDRGVADASFTLTPDNGATQIVWSLDTDMREGVPLFLQPVTTYLGFLMDGMVGEDYEMGLQNLKTVAETQSS